MRRHVGKILVVCMLFLVGLSMLLYPMLSDAWNRRRSDRLIEAYTQQAAETTQDDSAAWFAAADAYNRTLAGKGIPDAFAFISDEENEDYLSQLSFDASGVMAYLQIPRIQVSLPIYHTTSEKVLEHGVGHLEGSALPVGGEGTHCVLSAHRGLPSAALFTDLNLLEPGDHFYIYVLDRVLAYEVTEQEVVEPNQTQSLEVIPGEDLVTLVTCTPYGVNSHRLLVHGRRVEYVEQTAAEEAEHPTASVHTRYGLWVGCGLGVTAVLVLLMFLISRRVNGRRGVRG